MEILKVVAIQDLYIRSILSNTKEVHPQQQRGKPEIAKLVEFYRDNLRVKPKASYREHVRDFLASLSIEGGRLLTHEWGCEGKSLENTLTLALKNAANYAKRKARPD